MVESLNKESTWLGKLLWPKISLLFVKSTSMLSSIDEQSSLATTVEQIQSATLYTYFSRSVHREQTDLSRNFCLILCLFESTISTATNFFISESTCGPGTVKFEATGSADSELGMAARSPSYLLKSS